MCLGLMNRLAHNRKPTQSATRHRYAVVNRKTLNPQFIIFPRFIICCIYNNGQKVWPDIRKPEIETEGLNHNF
jgi:hypothetical protein